MKESLLRQKKISGRGIGRSQVGWVERPWRQHEHADLSVGRWTSETRNREGRVE